MIPRISIDDRLEEMRWMHALGGKNDRLTSEYRRMTRGSQHESEVKTARLLLL